MTDSWLFKVTHIEGTRWPTYTYSRGLGVSETIIAYRGYILEVTHYGVDVRIGPKGRYICIKVSLREAMRAIHGHRRMWRR